MYNLFTKNKTNIQYLFRAEELMPCIDYLLFKYIQNIFCLSIEHIFIIDTEISTREIESPKKVVNEICEFFLNGSFLKNERKL